MTRANKIYWAFTFLFFQVICAHAQTKIPSKNAWSFHSYAALGFLSGENGPAFHCETVNGMGNQSWFTGIGVGIDYYKFRTVPLFVDVKKIFLWKYFGLYGYADAGMNFPWVTNKQHSFYQSDFSNGFYGDFGLGFLVPSETRVKVFFSFGYSIKESKEKYTAPEFCPFNGPCYPNSQLIFYELNRFSIKAGINF
jgi:hypothetical protein